MVLLIDANIILDVILKREPFYQDSKEIMIFCGEPDVEGCVALHTVTTIWYLLRKQTDQFKRDSLLDVCNLLSVVGTTHNKIVEAVNNTEFRDFEDCIQSKCAESAKADYIITRNVSDFSGSEIPAVMPHEFLKKYKNQLPSF